MCIRDSEQVAQARLGESALRLGRLVKERNALLAKGPGTGSSALQYTKEMQRLNTAIQGTRNSILRWGNESQRAGQLAFTGFNKAVTAMQQIKILPSGITADMRRMAFDFQKQMGRLMTPGQLSKFFKVALNLDTAPANSKMANFMRAWQNKQIKLSADVKIKTGKVAKLTNAEVLSLGKGPLKRSAIEVPVIPKLTQLPQGFKWKLKPPTVTPIAKPAAAALTMKNAFRNPIKQKIIADIPDAGRLSALGAQITAGIQAGMKSVTQLVEITKTTNFIVNRIENDLNKAAETASPSKRFARTVGSPIIQGILRGMADRPRIEKAAALTMNLLQGAWMTKRLDKIENKPEFDKDAYAKLIQQATDARKRFQEEHKKIDLIRSKGYSKKAAAMKAPVKAINIKDLIRDTNDQAKAFRVFNKSMAELSRNKRVPRAMLDSLAAMGSEGVKYIKMLALSLIHI